MASFHGYANGAKDLLCQIRSAAQGFALATSCVGPGDGQFGVSCDSAVPPGSITVTVTTAGPTGTAILSVSGGITGSFTSGSSLTSGGCTITGTTPTTFNNGDVYTITTGVSSFNDWLEVAYSNVGEKEWTVSVPGPCSDSSFDITFSTITSGCETLCVSVAGSPNTYVYLDQGSEYFITIDNRSIIGTVVTNGIWENFYYGWVDPFSSELGQPSPLFSGGTGTNSAWKPTETNDAHSSFYHPVRFVNQPAASFYNCGGWVELQNLVSAIEVGDNVVWPYGSIRINNRCDGTDVWNQLGPGPNGGIKTEEAVIAMTPNKVPGKFRNFIAVAGGIAGDTIMWNGNNYLIVQNVASTQEMGGILIDSPLINSTK